MLQVAKTMTLSKRIETKMQSNTTIAKRYSKALFEAASSANALEIVENDVHELEKLIKDSSELLFVIHNRTYSVASLNRVFADILEKLNAHKVTHSFISLLIRNRRISSLSDILTFFFDLMRKENGQLIATVTTAREISSDILSKLADVLGSRLDAKINIDAKVRPEIIGGLIVEVDSFRFDASLKTKLSELQHTLERLA